MNVCFLEGDMSRSGGTERMTALIANELLPWRGRAHIYYQFAYAKWLRFSLDKHYISAYGTGNFRRRFLSIRRFFKENHIDIAINVDTGMGPYGIFAAAGLGTQVITWEHANFFNNWGSRVFPYIRRLSAQYSAALVVLTERDRQNYVDHIHRCAPIHVIHNPAAVKGYSYDITSKRLLSAGHLLSVKRFTLIPEIGKRVFAAHPDWRWVICGDGPGRMLEQLIREAKLEQNIVLTGVVQDMDAQYRGCGHVRHDIRKGRSPDGIAGSQITWPANCEF